MANAGQKVEVRGCQCLAFHRRNRDLELWEFGEALGPSRSFACPPQKPGEKEPLVWVATVRVSGLDRALSGRSPATRLPTAGGALWIIMAKRSQRAATS